MAEEKWALPQLRSIMPLEDGELRQIMTYADSLPDAQASHHLINLLGDSPEAVEYTMTYLKGRAKPSGRDNSAAEPYANSTKGAPDPPAAQKSDKAYDPPPGPPPGFSEKSQPEPPAAQKSDNAYDAPPGPPPGFSEKSLPDYSEKSQPTISEKSQPHQDS